MKDYTVWDDIEKIRVEAPQIHIITNYVVINIGTLSKPWVESMKMQMNKY